MENSKVEELLQLAKTLTGSNDIGVLVRAARQIGDWMASSKPSPENEPAFWLPAHSLPDFLKETKIEDDKGNISMFKPYMWQRHAAEMIDAYQIILLAGSRRMGVTELISRTLAYELTKPDTYSMLMSHKQAFSREIADRAVKTIRHLPLHGPKITKDNRTVIEVDTGSAYASRLCCKNMDQIGLKGQSLTMLAIEHGDFMPYSKVDEFLSYAMPLMARGGKLIITGNNPSDRKSLLGKLWQSPIRAARISVPWSNVLETEIPHLWTGVDKTREELSPDAFGREYQCGIGLSSLEEPLMKRMR